MYSLSSRTDLGSQYNDLNAMLKMNDGSCAFPEIRMQTTSSLILKKKEFNFAVRCEWKIGPRAETVVENFGPPRSNLPYQILSEIISYILSLILCSWLKMLVLMLKVGGNLYRGQIQVA